MQTFKRQTNGANILTMNSPEEKKFHIVRLAVSTYQSENYLEMEERAIASTKNLKYHGMDIPSDGELILISNTNFDFSTLPESVYERTKLIIHPNSGFDNIPYSLIKKYSFPVILGNPIRANPVAEYCLSCLFHHFTPVPFSKDWMPGRSWQRDLISHKSIQLIGHGHIGKILHQALAPLVKNIDIYDPDENFHKLNLSQADVVIIAAALRHQSFKMVNSDFLKQLKKDVVIINGARGKLVEQKDLIHFLKVNSNAHAYLDVFNQEPFDKGEFDQLDNVYLTSHIAGVYSGLDEGIASYVAKVVKDFSQSEEINFLENYKKINLQNFSQESFLN